VKDPATWCGSKTAKSQFSLGCEPKTSHHIFCHVIEGVAVHIQRISLYPKYKVRNFFFDLFMIAITGGLWLLWVFVREMRKQY